MWSQVKHITVIDILHFVVSLSQSYTHLYRTLPQEQHIFYFALLIHQTCTVSLELLNNIDVMVKKPLEFILRYKGTTSIHYTDSSKYLGLIHLFVSNFEDFHDIF